MPRWPSQNVSCIKCGKPRASNTVEPCQICKMHAKLSRRYKWTPEFDAALTHAYRGANSRKALIVAITGVVRVTGFPRTIVRLRAQELHLTCSHRRCWTRAEVEQLRELVGKMPALRIAKTLHRSYVAVTSQLSRMRISARLTEGYTVTDLAQCFGVAEMRVQKWIGDGWLRAGQYGRVAESAVTRFIKQHPEEYRLNRVDEAWFKGMIFTAFGVGMDEPKQPVRQYREEIQEARFA